MPLDCWIASSLLLAMTGRRAPGDRIENCAAPLAGFPAAVDKPCNPRLIEPEPSPASVRQERRQRFLLSRQARIMRRDDSHTWKEIAAQPRIWSEWGPPLAKRAAEVSDWIARLGIESPN